LVPHIPEVGEDAFPNFLTRKFVHKCDIPILNTRFISVHLA